MISLIAQEIINEILEINDDLVGCNPVFKKEYLGPICEECGRPRATEKAFIELREGDGTNLCWWDDCAFLTPDPVPYYKARLLAEEIMRLESRLNNS